MNEIPPMTDSFGVHWRQPSREQIVIDGLHALMDKATFDLLAEYSTSRPSGVYDGKMWRRHDDELGWLLVWYGPSPDPKKCSINNRVILLA
jgi:hypothetical protein